MNFNTLANLAFNAPKDRAPLIVVAAQLDAKAGVSDLIEACAILLRRRCEFRCELYGEGPDETHLRWIARHDGLSDRLQFKPGQGLASLREAVSRASVFALVGEADSQDLRKTAIYRQYSKLLHEAMAMGTPCLITDDVPAAELILDGETGLIEPRHYPSALAIALQRLLLDSALRVRLAKEARGAVESRCDLPAVSAAG